MARFTFKRLCRSIGIIVLLVFIFSWLSFDEENNIEYTEAMKSKTMLVDDFWVPEKGLSKATGPGDNGSPVYTSDSEEKFRQKSYMEYGFNQFISDKISLNRTIPDTRPKQ